ncbi:hypothetical protein AB8O38_15325 [Saccharomonospora xinjiangensis]|uniref:hypothetical protein n=1 Tax=Saccharomonospora xinjiangensis TaxID=75294 RepID=UPI00350F4D84
MTYPPQPGDSPYGQNPYGQTPYGQQPAADPYGQQPGMPYGGPASGGFPQQTQGFPQTQGYQQTQGFPQFQSYPQEQYGQQGGGWGPQQPPKKSKTGLWIGISASAVAVVAFLVTGLLAPGFLLSDEHSGAGGGDNGNTAGSPAAVAQQISTALTSGDRATLDGLACASATQMVHQAIGAAGQLGQVTINGEPQVSGTQATVQGNASIEGQNYPLTATLVQENGTWCWQDAGIETQSSGGLDDPATAYPSQTGDEGSGDGTGSGDSAAFIDEVGAALNAADSDALLGMVCEGMGDSTKVALKQAATTRTAWQAEDVSTTEITAGATFVSSAGDLLVLADNYDGPFCIASAVLYY